MADLISLTCPSCGGKLQITNDIERFACIHCGNEHIVRRGGGIVSLTPVVEQLVSIKAGVDKTASELAIKRLEGEIYQLTNKRAQLIARQESELQNVNHSVYAKLNEIESLNQSRKSDIRVIVVAFLGIVVAFYLIGGANPHPLFWVVLTILTIVFVFGIFRLMQSNSRNWAQVKDDNEKRIAALKKQHQNQLCILDNELQKCRSEIAEHRRIVAR